MLQALHIRDFAVIESLELELGSGLTVVTGETGAGKSVLINALSLVLGGRARNEFIRTGAETASVEALFDLTGNTKISDRLVASGLAAGTQLVVRRTVARSGRSKVFINGALATIQTLGQLMDGLVDISGQHAHYSLMRSENHLDLLDQVGGLGALRQAVSDVHSRVATLDARIAEIHSQRQNRGEREDFIRFQLQELVGAGLEDANEEEQLTQEASRVRNSERLRTVAQQIEHTLYSETNSVVEKLGVALRELRGLSVLDAELEPLQVDLDSALALAEETARTLAHYAGQLHAEPERLDALEERLTLLARLRRKHGVDLAEVMAKRDALQQELAGLEGSDDTLESLLVERSALAEELMGKGETLTAAREVAARELVLAVADQFADLGMAGAQLHVEFRPLASGVEVPRGFMGPRGAERIEFLLSANPGEAPQALARIASGGELSRFMLAVKTVMAHRDPVSTYVFDEVDTGVGGATAEAIGHKLMTVGESRQALCITHMPQIAALGERHLRVSKSVEENRTRSTIVELDPSARTEEIARMLGGAKITKTTRAHARELLSQSSSASS